MRDSDTYSAHATRCRQEAADAILDNVRDRALRAEAAWNAMAARSLKTEASRDARAAKVELEDVAAAG
ncbi:hypothetical protein [Sphingomonas sp.]|uniref:hypothetical protein n=1 Tax=Sphingomonas sp. TaxID=28214 RepID=UPI003CC517F3